MSSELGSVGSCDVATRVSPQTITERLHRRKDRLEKELSEVNAAITALEKHPEVQKVMDLVAKINY